MSDTKLKTEPKGVDDLVQQCANGIAVTGLGLVSAQAGKNTDITVTGPAGDVNFSITGHGMLQVGGSRNLTDAGGKVIFTYNVEHPGFYELRVFYALNVLGDASPRNVRGSPFIVCVMAPTISEADAQLETPTETPTETVAETPAESVPETLTETVTATSEESFPVSVPDESIEKMLLSYKDMPIELFAPLAGRLLAKNKNADIHLVTNNLSFDEESGKRLRVLLQGGIKLFASNGFRTSKGGFSVFSYGLSDTAKKYLAKYLLGLSGEDLDNARNAFQKKVPTNCCFTVPTPDSHDDCVRLCIHLRVVPGRVTDHKVLVKCAQAGIFPDGDVELLKEHVAVLADRDNALAELTSLRDEYRKTLNSNTLFAHANTVLTAQLEAADVKVRQLENERDSLITRVNTTKDLTQQLADAIRVCP